MTVPPAAACKKHDHQLRYRTLFDCCMPALRDARIRVIVNKGSRNLTA